MVRSGGEIDSSTAGDLTSRRRCGVRIWHVAFALPLCCVALVLSLRWHARHEFYKRIEAIRAAGYPATPQELEAWYKYPQSGVNAARWIMGAGDLYVAPRKEDWARLQPLVLLTTRNMERPDPAQPLDPNLMCLLEQYIQVNSISLKSLYDGAAIEECRYLTDLSKGAGTRRWTTREGMDLLCLEGVLHAERGDPNRTAEALKTALFVARTINDEPVMLSHLVATAGANAAAVTVERILNRVELTDSQLQVLSQAFQDFGGQTELLMALVGDRCLTYPVFDQPQSLNRDYYNRLPPKAVLEMYHALGLAAREGVAYLDYVQECIDILQSPMSQYRAAVDATQSRWLRGRKGVLFAHIGSAAFLLAREAVYVAPREMARVLLAVERYRLSHGSLPDAIDSLVPEYFASVPEDPHDGLPLRYRRLDRGYMVYSVGEDQRDDDGKRQPPEDARKHNETWDVVFQVLR
jgi:hypothetical protein